MSSEDERSRAESFQIGDKQVGIGKPCFVIAEAGVAHFGDLQKAKKLVDLAKYSGADAVKFQTFDVDALIAAESPEWKERLGGRCLKPQQFRELKAYCDEQRIIFLSTAHDEVGPVSWGTGRLLRELPELVSQLFCRQECILRMMSRARSVGSQRLKIPVWPFCIALPVIQLNRAKRI